MFPTASRLILEQHDRLIAIRGASVDPHIRRVLRLSALLLEDLNRSLVAVNQSLTPQNLLERIANPRVMQFGRANSSSLACRD